MVIKTFSLFYGSQIVTANNLFLNYRENGGPEIVAEITAGGYAPSEYVVAIKTTLEANSLNSYIYTVTFDRNTRQITISSATGNFDLLTSTGGQVGKSAWVDMGFTINSDKTGSNTYTGSNPAGLEYRPQIWFQDYLHPDHNLDLIGAKTKQTGSGFTETTSFGEISFLEFSLPIVTNLAIGYDFLRTRSQGVEECLAFLKNIVKKQRFEVMLDEDNPSDFFIVTLESLAGSSDGTTFRLPSTDTPGVYELNNVKLRVVA